MTVLLTGGGTGGHITPLLAVAHELKKLESEGRLVYVGERGGKFAQLISEDESIDESRYVWAGKFRRYHGQSWLSRIFDFKTNLLNLRDALRVFVGFWQSLILIGRVKPDVVFVKGGFVGVPVGLAAAILRVPYVTHDSDTVPGLANRIIGRWARWHATGMPAELYNYPKDKTKYVGIPLSGKYKAVDDDLKQEYKTTLGLPAKSRLLFITGGSQGAKRLNGIARQVVPSLMNRDDLLYVIHQVGKGNGDVYDGCDVDKKRLVVHEFINDMPVNSGAADVILTRGGASSIAEFAVQGKACIIIPHPYLTGGHQIKNAESLKSREAALVFDEGSLTKDATQLTESIEALFDNPKLRKNLEDNLSAMARPDAAAEIAHLISDMKTG